MLKKEVIEWLLGSDPSIRWQVLRDIQGEGIYTFIPERRKIATEGWGARLLAHQDANGLWGGQLYNNKWLSTTYTMLLLRQMGLQPDLPQALLACHVLLEGGYRQAGSISYGKTVETIDIGVTGMILSILAYFEFSDERVHAIVDFLLDQQMQDGRWEPFPGNQNLMYTFDGTLLVLEGLSEYAHRYLQYNPRVAEAQAVGREFFLRHKLFKSPETGEILNPNLTKFSFPPRWHYDVLTVLDYFTCSNAARDDRLNEAIDLVRTKRGSDGFWKLQNRHPGKTFFEMEEVGKPSKWNTLRALRVLRWWEN
jgi:hypothetical protein